jgi:hypothetical protein
MGLFPTCIWDEPCWELPDSSLKIPFQPLEKAGVGYPKVSCFYFSSGFPCRLPEDEPMTISFCCTQRGQFPGQGNDHLAIAAAEVNHP